MGEGEGEGEGWGMTACFCRGASGARSPRRRANELGPLTPSLARWTLPRSLSATDGWGSYDRVINDSEIMQGLFGTSRLFYLLFQQ